MKDSSRFPPVSAPLLAFSGGALINAVWLARAPNLEAGERILLHLLDLGHFVCLGTIGALGVYIFQRFLPARLWLRLSLLTLLAWLLGRVTLFEDLDHFSRRQESGLSPAAVLLIGVTVISSAVPIAHAVGLALQRVKCGWGGVALGAAGFLLNGLLLQGDYEGVHLFVALASGTLAGTCLAAANGHDLDWFPRRPAPIMLAALISICAFLSVAWKVPSKLRVVHSRAAGSVIVPLIGRVRAYWVGRRISNLRQASTTNDAWFASRATLPPLPSQPPTFLPKDAITIFLTVDALRADVINSQKYDDRIPNIARLRDESVWFENARSPGTLTKVSLTATFMSTYFSQQLWTGKRIKGPYKDPSPRFSQLLTEAGIRTINYRSISWIRNSGIAKGFSEQPYVKVRGHRYVPSKPLFAELLKTVQSFDSRPVFLYSHLSDPHAPYNLAKKSGKRFDRYLSEVELVDHQVGRLLALLDDTQKHKRTLFILSADHGEAFGEHGNKTHGTTLYDEELRVPLLIRTPNRLKRRIKTPVSLVDIGPTLLDAYGLATPGTMMGQSLVPYLRGQEALLKRPIAAETRLKQAMITPDGMKVIVDTRRNTIELYDLTVDPGEQTNLADDHPERLAEPLSRLRRFFEVHRLKKPGYEPPYIR